MRPIWPDVPTGQVPTCEPEYRGQSGQMSLPGRSPPVNQSTAGVQIWAVHSRPPRGRTASTAAALIAGVMDFVTSPAMTLSCSAVNFGASSPIGRTCEVARAHWARRRHVRSAARSARRTTRGAALPGLAPARARTLTCAAHWNTAHAQTPYAETGWHRAPERPPRHGAKATARLRSLSTHAGTSTRAKPHSHPPAARAGPVHYGSARPRILATD